MANATFSWFSLRFRTAIATPSLPLWRCVTITWLIFSRHFDAHHHRCLRKEGCLHATQRREYSSLFLAFIYLSVSIFYMEGMITCKYICTRKGNVENGRNDAKMFLWWFNSPEQWIADITIKHTLDHYNLLIPVKSWREVLEYHDRVKSASLPLSSL